ncbi:helix-turn-helix domain-containing protein [Azospirillum doebereinerae]|uniref:XRE family transcriptional regulator n=1 Tax=Azospirillum doebereinerae TaxID=92933 RepID=A0A433IZE2_9PROT|nr:helix-turn-helix transcriptional regulator [Azospirillum doebereinerae]RUQ60044.1 XRE family transcriptional regulator [Azospirillum doebereinerae]
MDIKNHIGARVKAARQRKGLTQEQLAEAVDKAVETISNIERGAMLTGIDTLQRIGTVLVVPMTYFFEGIEDIQHLSRARLEVELQLQAIGKRLPMRELYLAISLLEALEKFDRENN